MSFNSLFGLGGHSPDANLEGWWLMQETTGTTATDQSGKGRNGTIIGMGSNPVTATGPSSWLTSAFDFAGETEKYIEFPGFIGLSENARTYIVWRGRDSADAETFFKQNTSDFFFESFRLRLRSGGNSPQVEYGTVPFGWRHLSATISGTNGTLRVDKGSRVAGSLVGSATLTSDLRFGVFDTTGTLPQYRLKSQVAGAAVFSKALTTSEEDESVDGPEPINTTAPTLSGTEEVGQTLTCATGTWGLGVPFSGLSNGTITYSYQWTRSDDASGTGEADISGATSSTYTLVAADEGKFIRCRVRASNDGGFDADADTFSGFTGEIQDGAGDPTITAESGSFSLAGQDAQVTRSLAISAESGSFSLSGQNADFSSDRRIAAESGPFSLAGQNAQFDVAGITNLPADSGSFTLTGQDASLRRALSIIADHGTFDLSGQEATLTKAFRVAADSGAFSLVGQDAAFDVSGDQVIVADPGGFVLAGQAAEFDAPEPPPPPVKRYLVFRTN